MKLDANQKQRFLLEMGHRKVRFEVEYTQLILTKVTVIDVEKLCPENLFWFWKWIPSLQDVLEMKSNDGGLVTMTKLEDVDTELKELFPKAKEVKELV